MLCDGTCTFLHYLYKNNKQTRVQPETLSQHGKGKMDARTKRLCVHFAAEITGTGALVALATLATLAASMFESLSAPTRMLGTQVYFMSHWMTLLITGSALVGGLIIRLALETPIRRPRFSRPRAARMIQHTWRRWQNRRQWAAWLINAWWYRVRWRRMTFRERRALAREAVRVDPQPHAPSV